MKTRIKLFNSAFKTFNTSNAKNIYSFQINNIYVYKILKRFNYCNKNSTTFLMKQNFPLFIPLFTFVYIYHRGKRIFPKHMVVNLSDNLIDLTLLCLNEIPLAPFQLCLSLKAFFSMPLKIYTPI